MREIDARVTGFDYTTFHAYTTEVEVDGRAWTLAIRYNTFYDFYTRLSALEKHFTVQFPPKGGLFFSPPPEERQEQLDEFLLTTLAYFDMRGHPRRMEALLAELLQIHEHLDTKDDDERTASEGSSVAEELLLNTPMPGDEEVHGFEESGMEDEHEAEHQTEEDEDKVQVNAEVGIQVEDHEVEVAVPMAELEEKPVVVMDDKEEDKQREVEAGSSPMSEVKVQPLQEDEQVKGDGMAQNYISKLRRKLFVDGAIQAAVVSTMTENVEKSKTTKVETAVEDENPVKMEIVNEEAENVAVVKLEEPAAPLESPVQAETSAAEPTKEGTSETMDVCEEREVVTIVPEEETEEVVEPEVSEEAVEVVGLEVSGASSESHITEVTEPKLNSVAEDSVPVAALKTEDEPEEVSSFNVEAEEPRIEESEEKAAVDPIKDEPEADNPVVNWFRRMSSSIGSSAVEKEEEEKKVDVAQAESDTNARAESEAAKAEAKDESETVKAEIEAKLKSDSEAAKTEDEAKVKAESETAEAEAKAKMKAESEAVKAEAEAVAKAEAEEAELLRKEEELNLRLKLYRHPVFFQKFNCDTPTSRFSLPARLGDAIVV